MLQHPLGGVPALFIQPDRRIHDPKAPVFEHRLDAQLEIVAKMEVVRVRPKHLNEVRSQRKIMLQVAGNVQVVYELFIGHRLVG